MKKRVFKRGFLHSLIIGVAPFIVTLTIIGALIIGFNQAEDSSRAEGVRLLEETILRVAIHSYAVNGHFPESLDYIVENFNVHIDHTRFVVHYDVFALNILPDIIVFALDD
ncbi:MAG: hypothetical protein FWE33_01825 [Defluviitaleaceae bacterium]|nr:hypothetical protein [Defluviitaleaceae bacterium]